MPAADYAITAHNPARASENRIHDDEVAKANGFRGGLVPGVTVYAYACAPALDALGPAFLDKGFAEIRLVAPIYEGDEAAVRVEAIAGAGEETHSLSVSVGDTECATGKVRIAKGGVGVGDIEAPNIPSAERPEERPPASEEVFCAGRVLGSIDLKTDEATVEAYLQTIREPLPLYVKERLLHPGMLLNGANWILGANAIMPAWIHTQSRVQHIRSIQIGEPLEVRGVIASEYERKGRRHLTLDVAWIASGDLVAFGQHRAIWRLA